MAWEWLAQTGWSYACKRTARELAYHEAGHAVLQNENGYKVVRIYIDPGATSNAGATQTDPSSIPATPVLSTYADIRNFFVSLGATFVAGAVAEYLDCGGIPPPPKFPAFLQYCDSQQAHAVFQTFSALEQGGNEQNQTSFSTTFDDFLREASEHAFTVLTRRRSELDVIANALVAKNCLGASDCATLLP